MTVVKPKAAKPKNVSTRKPKKRGPKPKLSPDAKTLEEIRKVSALQCTVREGAALFRVALQTFENFLKLSAVKTAWDDGRQLGLMSLRRTQFKLAETNAAVAIFLGKNYLAQTDKLTHGHEFDFTGLTDEEIQIVMKGLARKAADTYAVKQAETDAPSPTVQ